MPGFVPFPPPANKARLWKLYLGASVVIDLGLFVALLIFGGLPLWTVADDVGQYVAARESRGWSSITGTVLSSGSVREGKGFAPVVSYSYLVEGMSYTGNRIVFAARRPVLASEAEVDRMLSPYGRIRETSEFELVFEGITPKPDRAVTVYYDPAAPQNSALRQEYVSNPELATLWPAIPISAFLIIILITSVDAWRRYISNREYESAHRGRLPA